jgi:hypothetical protein
VIIPAPAPQAVLIAKFSRHRSHCTCARGATRAGAATNTEGALAGADAAATGAAGAAAAADALLEGELMEESAAIG